MHAAPRRDSLGHQGFSHWLVVGVALAGLFAMHGMSDHGAAGHGSMPDLHAGSAASPDHPHGSINSQAETDSPNVEIVVSGSALDGDMGLVGLCMAVLVAIVLVGAWLLIRARALSRRPAGRAATAKLLARARAPDPPDLFRLSIQRC